MRDEQGVLRCDRCDQPLPGRTANEEVAAVQAHQREHGFTITLVEAKALRALLERTPRARA